MQADVDCDGDTILFRVRQKGDACHFDRYSCFASQKRPFDLSRLTELLTRRKNDLPEKSFTTQLFKSAEFRAEKITEEAQELIEAESFDEVRWEAADLIFFALTDALAKGVEIDDVVCELRSRFNDN